MLAGAQRLVGMVIRNDEQDVRFFILPDAVCAIRGEAASSASVPARMVFRELIVVQNIERTHHVNVIGFLLP